MVKVCHMTSAHKSLDVRIFQKQCTSLAKKGYATYLVSGGESFVKNGVNIVGVGEFSGGRFKRMTSKAREVYKKALELDCDIYQIHDPELIPYALKLKKKGKNIVFDSHEDYNMQIAVKPYLPKIVAKSIAKVFSIYQNYALKKFDGAIFPCLKDGKHIFENKCKNIITLGNEPMLNELYDTYDVNFDKIQRSVCHVGGLTYARGIKHITLASHKVKANLILGGNITPESFKSELESINEFECVDFRGFCSRDEVVDILQSSQIGICTILNIGQYNVYDNFATKVYEYMAMGLPVIMTDYQFAREVNEKYNFAILVDPENVEEISNAITYLLDNPEEAKQMGENGRRAIKEEFNWDIEVDKLFKLYEEIL